MSPKRIGGLPDWALDQVHDCYTASLRTNPAQRGSLAFTVVPPAAAGNVEVDLKSEGSLQPDVVNCARGALQSIYHYPKGRRQPKLSATVTLEPELIQAPAPPTDKLARRLAAVRYAEAGVVEIVEYTTESIGHRSMLGDLVREMRYRLKLRFVRDGYEGLCVHHAQYKRFEVDPVKPRGAGHMCDSKPRKKGDETDDSGVHYFHLTDGGWRQAFSGGPLYCGDGVCR